MLGLLVDLGWLREDPSGQFRLAGVEFYLPAAAGAAFAPLVVEVVPEDGRQPGFKRGAVGPRFELMQDTRQLVTIERRDRVPGVLPVNAMVDDVRDERIGAPPQLEIGFALQHVDARQLGQLFVGYFVEVFGVPAALLERRHF